MSDAKQGRIRVNQETGKCEISEHGNAYVPAEELMHPPECVEQWRQVPAEDRAEYYEAISAGLDTVELPSHDVCDVLEQVAVGSVPLCSSGEVLESKLARESEVRAEERQAEWGRIYGTLCNGGHEEAAVYLEQLSDPKFPPHLMMPRSCYYTACDHSCRICFEHPAVICEHCLPIAAPQRAERDNKIWNKAVDSCAGAIERRAENYPEDVFPEDSTSRDAIAGSAMRDMLPRLAKMLRERERTAPAVGSTGGVVSWTDEKITEMVKATSANGVQVGPPLVPRLEVPEGEHDWAMLVSRSTRSGKTLFHCMRCHQESIAPDKGLCEPVKPNAED